MPRPKDWDVPKDLASAAREAGIRPDWSDPDFLGFVEEHKWNEREYNTEWKRNNIDAARARQISGEYDSAKQTHKITARENEAAEIMRGGARAVDSLPPTPQRQETPSGYAYVPAPANNPPLSIKPMPQRDRTKDFDRDR